MSHWRDILCLACRQPVRTRLPMQVFCKEPECMRARQELRMKPRQQMCRRQGITFEKEKVKEICRRYQGGESLGSIARSFGCSDEPIRRLLVEHGVEIRPGPNAKHL